MQSLVIEAKRHALQNSKRKLEKCLDLLQVLISEKSKQEKEYSLCRYNESLWFSESLDTSHIGAELKRLLGYFPDWGFVSELLPEEVDEHDDKLVEILDATDAIWWDTSEGLNFSFLPPRPLEEGDLQVHLTSIDENTCILTDSDGDKTPVEKETAHFALSEACRQRKGGYPLLSYCIENIQTML